MHIPAHLTQKLATTIATTTHLTQKLATTIATTTQLTQQLTTTIATTTNVLYKSKDLNEASEYLHFIKENYGSLLIILAVLVLLFLMYFALVLNDQYLLNKIMNAMKCIKSKITFYF